MNNISMAHYHKQNVIEWTEDRAQSTLWNELRNASKIVVPNFTPRGWWECDMWSLTRSDYAQEHEIKLTRSDFLADAKKHKMMGTRYDRMTGTGQVVTKYAAMQAATHDACPKQFYYVTPRGMLFEDEIPEWAGLKELNSRYGTVVIKKAPVLHKRKARESDIDRALWNLYYRYWDLKVKKAWEKKK